MAQRDDFVGMESKIRNSSRNDFVKKERAVEYLDHEVFIAVKQLNIDVLETEALSRSTPGSPDYRQWMSMDEVNAIRGNDVGTESIRSWLVANGVDVTWTSVAGTYMKARTTIGHWERLLHTTFHMYEDQKEDQHRRQLPRAESYSLPASIREHVHAFFEVSELPARLSHNSVVKDVAIERKILGIKSKDNLRSRELASSACSGQATIQCLNEVYNIDSNLGTLRCLFRCVSCFVFVLYSCVCLCAGSSSVTQSVFETSTQSFSPTDLTKFQNTYDCTVQSAIDVGGYQVLQCNTNSGPYAQGTCFEGNLDIQYIMGMAQITTSTYYYVPSSGNPFVSAV